MLETPGFVAAQRFGLSDVQKDGASLPSHRYLAVYELAVDTREALDGLSERAADREPTEAIASGSITLYWSSIGPRLESKT